MNAPCVMQERRDEVIGMFNMINKLMGNEEAGIIVFSFLTVLIIVGMIVISGKLLFS